MHIMRKLILMLFICVGFAVHAYAQEMIGQRVIFKKDSVTVDESQFAMLEMMASYFKAHPKGTERVVPLSDKTHQRTDDYGQ